MKAVSASPSSTEADDVRSVGTWVDSCPLVAQFGLARYALVLVIVFERTSQATGLDADDGIGFRVKVSSFCPRRA